MEVFNQTASSCLSHLVETWSPQTLGASWEFEREYKFVSLGFLIGCPQRKINFTYVHRLKY